jgi:hypothetical protein
VTRLSSSKRTDSPSTVHPERHNHTVHGKPRTARYLSDLTPKMSVALVRCHTTVVLVGDHHTKGISTPTINALVRRQLLAEGRDKKARRTWKPTHAGITLDPNRRTAVSRPAITKAATPPSQR